MAHEVVVIVKPEEIQRYAPTTVAALGRDEAYLESVIADEPSILGLESKASGIYGPFVAFRQLTFTSPQGRSIRPDIVFLSASGHPVVVEVKLHANAELKDRRVIAQVVDYASAFAAMDEQSLLSVFTNGSRDINSWPGLIEQLFPDEEPEELANEFLRRFSSGEIKLVIACDKAPIGLRETVEGVAVLNALAFEFSVIEVRPYSIEGDPAVLFLARPRLETDIVARTLVTVTYQEGVARPGVSVTVDSPRKVEDAVRDVQRRTAGRRRPETTVDAAVELVDERVHDLIESKRLSPTFCWQGYALGTQVQIEGTGRGQLGIGFLELSTDPQKHSKTGTVYVSVHVNNARIPPAKFERFIAMARDGVGAEMVKLGGKEDIGPQWIHWNFQRHLPTDEDWTPEAITDYVERWFRLLTARLPVRAP